MKTWLKGGLISLVIFLILIVLSLILPSSDMGNIFHWILLIIGLPAYLLARFVPIGFGAFSSFFVILIPYSFILGAIIGLIVNKIKSKKK